MRRRQVVALLCGHSRARRSGARIKGALPRVFSARRLINRNRRRGTAALPRCVTHRAVVLSSSLQGVRGPCLVGSSASPLSALRPSAVMRKVIGFSSSAVRNTFLGSGLRLPARKRDLLGEALGEERGANLGDRAALERRGQRKDQTILACERGGEDDELGVGELHGSLRGMGEHRTVRAPPRGQGPAPARFAARTDRRRSLMLSEQRFVHAHKIGEVRSRARGQARIEHDVQVIHRPVGTP